MANEYRELVEAVSFVGFDAPDKFKAALSASESKRDLYEEGLVLSLKMESCHGHLSIRMAEFSQSFLVKIAHKPIISVAILDEFRLDSAIGKDDAITYALVRVLGLKEEMGC